MSREVTHLTINQRKPWCYCKCQIIFRIIRNNYSPFREARTCNDVDISVIFQTKLIMNWVDFRIILWPCAFSTNKAFLQKWILSTLFSLKQLFPRFLPFANSCLLWEESFVLHAICFILFCDSLHNHTF